MRVANVPNPAKSALALTSEPDTILNKRQVAAMAGVSSSTLDRMIARSEFDKPRQLSPRRVGWALSTVQAWIASRPQRAA
jgi:prophage regulatory protein